MISEALQHCHGVGPFRLAKLHAAGVRSWYDVLAQTEQISTKWRAELVAECRRCLAALDAEDIQYFVDRLAPEDKWRILDRFFDQAAFFDIETLGLNYDAPITVIVCWHHGKLSSFVEHENLDEFLTFIDRVKLLVSFNGNAFDVPRVLSAFHIPALPCPHLDLRWPCYHHGFSGGLKEIARRLGIERPADLQDASGELAVQLWQTWRADNDYEAREYLIRYCAADVLLLIAIAHRLTGRDPSWADDLWSALPSVSKPPALSQRVPVREQIVGFGVGTPMRIRAERRKLVG